MSKSSSKAGAESHGQEGGSRPWSSPPGLGLSAAFFSLVSLPSFFPFFPVSPSPHQEFYLSLMVGVPERLLATPGPGLGTWPPPRGHRVPLVPVYHRDPSGPGRAPGAPGSEPGCSASLQLRSLLMWGWSSSWDDLWALWVLPVHL